MVAGEGKERAPGIPASAVDYGLMYVNDAQPGFARVRWGRGFRYRTPEGAWLANEAHLERIKSLVLPPAWENVWICTSPRGHLQATGKDEARRKQYRYHEKWSELRNQTKFDRMAEFAEALPGIRRRILVDIEKLGMPLEKVAACVVRLLDHALIRVGNDEYARTNRSYGLTTIRQRHVDVHGSEIAFSFRGKSGTKRELSIDDPIAAEIVRACQELPHQELFQYVNERGEICDVSSTHVNEYLHAVVGEAFTAKDFRTWGGTVVAAERFDSAGPPVDEQGAPHSDAELKRREIAAVRCACAALGNTVATCRKYYVHPLLHETYCDGRLAKAFAKTRKDRAPRELRVSERAVKRVLEMV